jgi:inhibitor of KinA
MDVALNEQVMALHRSFANHHFPGFIETVPAYSSLAVFYDLLLVRANHPPVETAFDLVKSFSEKLLRGLHTVPGGPVKPVIHIPVLYNGQDLDHIALQRGLEQQDVIKIHSERIYRVFMIGFLPGFAYMGEVDERIATARLAAPRIRVNAGSVGIAGNQTGIYPMDSPGGWQLLGQTPIKIFDSSKAYPCLLEAGDEVKFNSISQEEFEKLNEY